MASCQPLFFTSPSIKLVDMKYATVLQSNTIRWLVSMLLVGIVSDKIQLVETEMQAAWDHPPLAWNPNTVIIHIFWSASVWPPILFHWQPTIKKILVKKIFLTLILCHPYLKCLKNTLVKISTGSRQKVSAQQDYIFPLKIGNHLLTEGWGTLGEESRGFKTRELTAWTSNDQSLIPSPPHPPQKVAAGRWGVTQELSWLFYHCSSMW